MTEPDAITEAERELWALLGDTDLLAADGERDGESSTLTGRWLTRGAIMAAARNLALAVHETLDPRNQRGLLASGWTWPLYLEHVATVYERLKALGKDRLLPPGEAGDRPT